VIIDDALLDRVTAQAQKSPRLRMNYNFHETLDARSQRLLNALEPGTVLPIHRHANTAETYIVLRGRIKIAFYNDNKEALEENVLDSCLGKYGVDIPKNTWHTIEVLETGTVIFEVKDGPYTPLTPENILE
jgi:cupin fold WbuC family metalloprotein